MEDRTAVLATSLVVENFISLYLGVFLGIDIKAQKESKSLKMGALSFSQKVDLLIDMRVLEGKERAVLQMFMEVRNLFMHDFFANNYFKCYELLQKSSRNGLKNRYYPQHSKDSSLAPDEAKDAIERLSKDAIEIIKLLYEKTVVENERKFDENFSNKYREASYEVINELKSLFDSYASELKKEGETVDVSKFIGIGTLMSKLYYAKMSDRMGLNKNDNDKSKDEQKAP